MNAADRVIRWSTALAVVGVAAVAAVVSYEHASDLVWEHGESGWTGRLIPLTVDGLIYASSMVMLESAWRGVRVPALARWLLGLGIIATLAANVAHGLGHGSICAVVAMWPAVALAHLQRGQLAPGAAGASGGQRLLPAGRRCPPPSGYLMAPAYPARQPSPEPVVTPALKER
jgi:uncharacterized protein DUF2637